MGAFVTDCFTEAFMGKKITKAAKHGGQNNPGTAAVQENSAPALGHAVPASNHPVLLTVSILVSNRTDTVRKCLDSVKPLLSAIPSELIVVDTVGPENSDGSLAVAREYTDNIVRFEWCDDFAAARNAGLSLARGEWFLFLDDDEWFEDVSPIIDFLRENDSRYGVCLYRVRNYLERSGREYEDAFVERMFRRNAAIRFRDRIHEQLEGAQPPVKTLDAYVHHYGYVYESRETFEKHWRRNSRSLEKMLEEQPGYLRAVMHLAQEYLRGKEYVKAEALCRGSIPENASQTVDKYVSMIACYFTHLLMENKKWREAFDQSERLLARPDISELAKCHILFQRSERAEILLPFEKLVENADAYFRFADLLDADPDKLSLQRMFTLDDCLSETSRASVTERALQRAVDLGDRARCRAYIQRIAEKPGEHCLIFMRCLPLMVRYAAEANEIDWLYAQIEPLFTVDDCLCGFVGALQAHVESFKPYEWPDALIRNILALPLDGPYILLLRMRAADAAGDIPKLAELFERYCTEESAGFADEIVETAYRNHLNLSGYAGKTSISDWDAGMRKLADRCTTDRALCILQYVKTFFPDDSPEVLSLEAAVQLKSLRDHGAAQTESLLRYAELNYAYSVALYGAANFTQNRSHYLGADARAALCLKEAMDAGERGDFASQARQIKKALGLRGELVEFADLMMKDLEKRIQRKDRAPKADVSAEFLALAARLKNVVAEFILKGDYKNARAVLDQLKTLLPGDPDIPKLYMQLGR